VPASEAKNTQDFYLIDQLVARANAVLNPDRQITERNVRYYMTLGLIGKGQRVSELPESFTATLGHKGNQRFFTDVDRDLVITIKNGLANGQSVEALGGKPLTSKSMFLSESFRPAPTSTYLRSFEVNSIISPDLMRLPGIQDTWTLQLRNDLTLTGSGSRPSTEAIRALQSFTEENFPPVRPHDYQLSEESYDFEDDEYQTGSLKIEIEYADIASPFEGLLINASNAEATPGGGASGRIWEVCGADLLMQQRPTDLLPMKPGQAIFTNAGRGEDLGFTGVIHAFGPRWTSPVNKDAMNSGIKQRSLHGEEDTLIRTWQTILAMADERSENRLVAPLISSGLFGFPFQDCAEITFQTLLETPTRVRHVQIRTVSRRLFQQLVETRYRVMRKLDII